MTTNNNGLQNKAMLVRLSISQWTARKYDKKISEKVASDYNTDQDAGRYNKVLVALDAIKAIQKAANEARTYHYENTLPWGDDEKRLLPAVHYMEYTAKMRGFKAAFEAEVNGFLSKYPALVDDARLKLNGMFNPADYPNQWEIQSRYAFTTNVEPLPAAADFRVSLADEEIARIKADLEARSNQAQADAMKDLWQRLHDVVSRMADRLKDKDAVFRNSLIQNIADLTGLLPKLNILDDPGLETMRQEIEKKLCSYNPDNLRVDKAERAQAAQDANDILAAMAGYMGK